MSYKKPLLIVQFSSVAQLCLTLCNPLNCSTPDLPVHHQLQVHPNVCPLCRWCHPTISSSVVPFSSCPQSFPASGSFQTTHLFTSGGVSASTSVPPMNTQDWSPLGGTGWISLQSKGLSRVFSNTTEGSDLAHSLCTLSLALCTWQGNWRYCWMKYDFADIFFTKADSTGPPSPPPERVGKSGLWGLN